MSGSADIPWILKKEWGGEAGNMLVLGKADDYSTPIAWLTKNNSMRNSPIRTPRQASREA
jgi:hypothetical protein